MNNGSLNFKKDTCVFQMKCVYVQKENISDTCVNIIAIQYVTQQNALIERFVF